MLRASPLLICALVLGCASAPVKTAEVPKGPAPILDRELFFGDPQIIGAQLSPDGRFIAFIKPFKGVRNVWVKETGKPFDSARPVTADAKRPVPAFFWSRDARWIFWVQDQAGDENYNLYAVDPTAGPAAGKDVPQPRDLTGLTKVQVVVYQLPKREPDVVYVGINDRDPAWHDLYRIHVSSGTRELVRKNTERITGWVFDHAGTLRLATRSTEAGENEVLRVDGAGFSKVLSCSVLETCDPIRFDPSNSRVYLQSNVGAGVDLLRLTLLDPATGKEELVESDPEGKVDLENAIFSEATDALVGTEYVDEKARYHFRDPAWKADHDLLVSRLPGKQLTRGSSTRDDQLWLVEADSDTEPGETWLFDRRTKALTLQYRVREQIPREALAPMTYIHYPSSDGLSIPAYLTVPRGVEAKNLPLIVFPHGGPWSRTPYGFHGYAQFLANRGYAVLEPNFRGSTGYGKKFLDAGNGQWGDRMQDDLTWGVKSLVASGTVDPQRVGIMGGSYGGYATLAGVTFTPDLYRAAVAIVAPSNLISLLETIPPYWEPIRILFYTRMGDPRTPQGRAQLDRQSPLNSAGKIKTPLLVVQGANDPRVNKRESDQIVVALRDRGFDVGYIVAPDEGHGFDRPINNLATMAATEAFLAKHLGGRVQTDMTPEIATRLAEITVDPKTVRLASRIDPAKVETPRPTSDLVARTARYASVMHIGDREVRMDVTRRVSAVKGGWAVVDVARGPMGEMQDRTVVQRKTLIALSRDITQGPMKISIQYAGGKASGKMAMGGAPKAFEADLGGPSFAEGNAEAEVLGRLPLAPGYTTVYRQLDVRRQKPVYKQVKVTGEERVTVKAGTFDTYRVEVTNTETNAPMTLWVDRTSRRAVKQTATLPEMGGAQYTTELVK